MIVDPETRNRAKHQRHEPHIWQVGVENKLSCDIQSNTGCRTSEHRENDRISLKPGDLSRIRFFKENGKAYGEITWLIS
jgi:hypothetical protein